MRNIRRTIKLGFNPLRFYFASFDVRMHMCDEYEDLFFRLNVPYHDVFFTAYDKRNKAFMYEGSFMRFYVKDMASITYIKMMMQ